MKKKYRRRRYGRKRRTRWKRKTGFRKSVKRIVNSMSESKTYDMYLGSGGSPGTGYFYPNSTPSITGGQYHTLYEISYNPNGLGPNQNQYIGNEVYLTRIQLRLYFQEEKESTAAAPTLPSQYIMRLYIVKPWNYSRVLGAPSTYLPTDLYQPIDKEVGIVKYDKIIHVGSLNYNIDKATAPYRYVYKTIKLNQKVLFMPGNNAIDKGGILLGCMSINGPGNCYVVCRGYVKVWYKDL